MPDIVVNDLNPRIQFLATGAELTFVYPFPIFANTDLNVYVTPPGIPADDATQLLQYNIDYTVTNNVAPTVGGFITPIGPYAPTIAGQIWTIVRNMPDDRLNNYTDGGGITATNLNTDFDRTVFMNQQNKLYLNGPGSIGVQYNNSAVITPVVDNILPVLPPNTVWAKNAANTQIVAVALGSIGGVVGGIVLPSTPGALVIFNNNGGVIESSDWTVPAADSTRGNNWTTNGAGAFVWSTTPGNSRMVNGNFQVFQRVISGGAVTLVGATQYVADRWQSQAGAATSGRFSQQVGNVSGQKVMRVQRTNGNAGVAPILISQTMYRDMCNGMAGNPITVQFKARAGANYSSLLESITISTNYGTGNTDVSNLTTGFAGETNLSLNVFLLTPNLTLYTFTTPALPANATQLEIRAEFTPTGVAGAADYFEITEFDWDVTPNYTPYRHQSFDQVYTRALMYYQQSFHYAFTPAQDAGTNIGEAQWYSNNAGANPTQSTFIRLPSSVNTNSFLGPVVIIYNPAALNAEVRDETADVDTTVSVINTINDSGFYVTYTSNAATAVGNIMGIHWTYDADLY